MEHNLLVFTYTLVALVLGSMIVDCAVIKHNLFVFTVYFGCFGFRLHDCGSCCDKTQPDSDHCMLWFQAP